jgi:hypothetical protein
MESKIESRARQLMAYSFLVVFANDDTIDEAELKMLEKLALEDGVVDEEERKIPGNLFSRVSKKQLGDKVWEEIESFRKEYDI